MVPVATMVDNTGLDKPIQYCDLPDLSADLSTSSSTSTTSRPSFEQLNATLLSRGYLRAPLNVAGVKRDVLDALADVLHAMIAQREEDLEVRTVLTAKNRTLTASLERTKRFLKEETDRSSDGERRAEAAKAKLNNLTSQLEAEQSAHRSTKEALGRTRRDLQVVKAAALQYKASNDRSVARIRSRIGEVTTSAIRAAVLDFRIVASAFEERPGSSQSASRITSSNHYEKQVEELENKRAHLVDYNQALKRLATEAINAARKADQELLDIVEVEEDDAKKRDNLAGNSTSASHSSTLSTRTVSKRLTSSDSWLEGHQPLYQRDLFPANDTLRSTAAGTLVSGSGNKNGHPALRALHITASAMTSHVQTLLDLRSARSAYETEVAKKMQAGLQEHDWRIKLEDEIREDILNDARLSLNKANGGGGLSLASAVASATSGTSGGTAKRVDWQREKVDLEKKLTNVVKDLAVVEEKLTRKEKELKRALEAEKRSRTLLEQLQSGIDTKEGEEDMSKPNADADTRKALELQMERYSKLSEELERERKELQEIRAKMSAETMRQGAGDTDGRSIRTKMLRLDEAEIAALHARDFARRHAEELSVVQEDVEMSTETGTVLKEEEARDSSPRSGPDDRSNGTSTGAAAQEDVVPANIGGNPELDAIFGIGSFVETAPSKPKATLARRSARLSGGGVPLSASASTSSTESASGSTGKRKAIEDVPTSEGSDSSSTSQRRSSRRISGPSMSAADELAQTEVEPVTTAKSDPSSVRAVKRPRIEASSSSSSSSSSPPPASKGREIVPRQRGSASLSTLATDQAKLGRRLSTREKAELEQRKSTANSSTSSSGKSAKTPAVASRRVVSSSSSSVTRPTASSAKRSEAILAEATVRGSTGRVLANTTNMDSLKGSTGSKSVAKLRSVSSGSTRSGQIATKSSISSASPSRRRP